MNITYEFQIQTNSVRDRNVMTFLRWKWNIIISITALLFCLCIVVCFPINHEGKKSLVTPTFKNIVMFK